MPFQPELIGDAFDGVTAGLLEQRVVEVVRRAGVVGRTSVRSFDHRSVRTVRPLLPALRTAVLVAGTAPILPAQLAHDADATTYCPEFTFLDEVQVRQLHAAGVRVVPWTVNDAADLDRLLAWGVDGVTTDYPDRLASVLCARNGVMTFSRHSCPRAAWERAPGRSASAAWTETRRGASASAAPAKGLEPAGPPRAASPRHTPAWPGQQCPPGRFPAPAASATW